MKTIINYSIIIIILSLSVNCKSSKKNTQSSKTESIKPVILKEYSIPSEFDYTIESANLADSILTIEVKYKGGCGKHNFELLFNGMYAKSLPPQAGLLLQHKVEKETCDKEVSKKLKFNVNAIKYSNSKNKTVIIRLKNFSDKIPFNY